MCIAHCPSHPGTFIAHMTHSTPRTPRLGETTGLDMKSILMDHQVSCQLSDSGHSASP